MKTYLKHESMGIVDKEGWVTLRGRLETELGVRSNWIIHEYDCCRQFAIIQHL